MRLSAIVKVDSKGRITIPQTIRESLNITPGMPLALIADIDTREIVISPISEKSAEVYEIEMELVDRMGALAEVTQVLAKHGVDIIASRCVSILRGRMGSCTIIADLTSADVDAEKLREILENLEDVRYVRIRSFKLGSIHA
ncbi:AbrB/MazE/SpoVT family DNA-binding domain-containing protein [Stetteria hydrogenophila]